MIKAIDNFTRRNLAKKKMFEILCNKGLYDNYGRISRHTSVLKKIHSKISTLELKESMGGDLELEEKIAKLESGVSFRFEVFVFGM